MKQIVSEKKSLLQKTTPKTGAPLWQRMWRERWIYLLITPGLIYFVVFQYLPLLGNLIAFQDFSPFLGFFESPWVGLDNFARLFSDPDVGIAISNTLIISLLQIIFAFPIPIALAIMLNNMVSDKARRFLQSILYLPHFISWVIIISIFQQILGGDGFINNLIRGTGGQPLDIMSNPDFFKPLVVIQVVWKDSGWGTIIFLAALTAIDLSLYEAAVIDGANKWRRIWHITLPGIRSTIILLLVLRLGTILNTGFEQIFLQRNAVGAQAAEVLDTFVYFRGVQAGDWGFSTAVGLVKGLVGLILILGANKLARKFGEEGLF
ncbi:MAG: sugar transporter permease [Chloroflexi bacterium]|jgi:putative aldouronate transport system permease protein|nr:sugar transporter permease [Chloroflexota bacterium]